MLRFLPALALGAALCLNAAAGFSATLLAPDGGAIRALVMGVDKYTRLGEGAQLHGAVADAKDLAQALGKGGVTPTVLLDGQVTRARVLAELNRLVETSRAGDFVLISYAGHGMQVPEYPQWKGADQRGVNEQIALAGFSYEDAGRSEVVVNKELRALLYRLDAKGVDVLVVMDSCFGGGMRGVDVRSAPIRVRQLTGGTSAGSFQAIATTPVEVRAEVRDMPHVTFLGGASANSVVPETSGLQPDTTRGALSFFVARAIEGAASPEPVVTPERLFRYVPQNVRQKTNERQNVDLEPRSRDRAVLDRAVFRFRSDNGAPPSPDQTEVQTISSEPVRVAIVGGDASAFSRIVKRRASYIQERDPANADLVWDPARAEVVSRGDLVMQFVDGAKMGGIIDRTFALKQLQKLSERRVLDAQLSGGGRIYVRGDGPEVVLRDLPSSEVVVFNIAADSEVQTLLPAPAGQGACPRPSDGQWACKLNVTPPYGADSIVAIASSKRQDIADWLAAHHSERDAALLPEFVAALLKVDPGVRIGSVNLFTQQN